MTTEDKKIVSIFRMIEKYSERYEFSFQFWGEGNNNVFVGKDDVDLYSGGGYDNPMEAMEHALEYLDKINPVRNSQSKNHFGRAM